MRCLDFGGDFECDMEEEYNREEGVSYILFHASHCLDFPNFPRHSREEAVRIDDHAVSARPN